ncbi:MAG: mannose-6-phosphate isomerase, class I [Spirochaetia bacterium]|jgi:mannose-6-phosphate isomerase|nr:mannose-6-phosphate isomerase, class I [Spirochaetia bacterium]
MKNSDNSLCRVFKFIPVLKNYDWGSVYSIQKITENRELEGKPVAELWMGAHKKGEGTIIDSAGKKIKISDFIEKESAAVLGSRCSKKYGGKLPFLFKILAAERALSIQVHPSKEEAEKGFADEEKKKIDIESSRRNYKDSNHKPELIYSLTEFSLMKGFRSAEDVCGNIEKYTPLLNDLLREKNKKRTDNNLHVNSGRKEGIDAPGDSCSNSALSVNSVNNTSSVNSSTSTDLVRELFTILLLSDKKILKKMIDQTLERCGKFPGIIGKTVISLFEIYRYDSGVLSPLFLNIINLRPGQALFIPAGELHAYISGTGFEVMASSDNVIRGGLTKKHVDTAGLLEITKFSQSDTDLLVPQKTDNEIKYVTPAKEFVFSVISLESREYTCSDPEKSIELFFFTGEQCRVKIANIQQPVLFKNGESFLIPACADKYVIKGTGHLYRASVNI